MKQFVLITKSESSDRYLYFIEHTRKPTDKEIEKFLEVYASDKDEEQVYEHQQDLIEIEPKKFRKIQKDYGTGEV